MIRRLVLIALPLALLASVAVYYLRQNEAGIPVEIEPSRRQASFRSFVTASGEIVAARYADIGSDVMGKVISLPVAEGQSVSAGQLLARIDPVQAKAQVESAQELVRALEAEELAAGEQIASQRFQVERARAVTAEARLNLDRLEKLYKQGVIPASQLDSARAAYETSQADLAASRANLDRAENTFAAAQRRVAQAIAQAGQAKDILGKTEIRSPISGIVSRLRVREGEMVVIGIQNQPGTTLMTISDLTAIDAEVKVAEADILRIRLGQMTQVTLDALPDRRFSGEVTEIGTSALTSAGSTAAAREFRVVIRLDAPEPGMRPGLTCDAEILTDELNDVITVPLQSVVVRDEGGVEQTGIFLNDNGFARFVAVRAGIIGGLDIVVDGIDAEQSVIVGPVQTLRDLKPGESVTPSSN